MLRLNIKVFKCGLYLCTRYMYMHLWLIPRLYPIYPLPYTPHLTIWRYWWSKMFDFHLPEAQQFPNSNAAIGFKSNPITTSYRKYAKQSMFDSMVTVVFAKNYPKHAKLMVCVWNPRRCWPPLLRHFEASMAIFFFSIEMGIKNRREMRSVGVSTDFRMHASISVHKNVTLLIYFFIRIISV